MDFLVNTMIEIKKKIHDTFPLYLLVMTDFHLMNTLIQSIQQYYMMKCLFTKCIICKLYQMVYSIRSFSVYD